MLARCKLFIALSMIQRGILQNVRFIISEQQKVAKRYEDQRLSNMCKGVLARMAYAKAQIVKLIT